MHPAADDQAPTPSVIASTVTSVSGYGGGYGLPVPATRPPARYGVPWPDRILPIVLVDPGGSSRVLLVDRLGLRVAAKRDSVISALLSLHTADASTAVHQMNAERGFCEP